MIVQVHVLLCAVCCPGGPCQRGGRATERTLSSDGGGGETTRLPAEVSGGEAGNREGGVAGELHPETGDGFPRQREGDERETTTGERQGGLQLESNLMEIYRSVRVAS